MSQQKEDLNYRVKQIKFQGRTYPILLQDVNGPCPILAIANVLLLRGQLKLPAGVGEVSEERLVQLVAGYLLDATSLDGREGQVSEEYRANLAHNVSDAIALLPKLTTGIDVNLRFHDIRGFEFTNEVAVFDLLDIGLVHGWLCDPQDEATCCALGQKSYNELVIQLVTTLGGACTPKRPTSTPRAFSGRQHGAKYAAAAALAAAGSGAGPSEALPTIQEDPPAAGAAAAAAPSKAGAGPINAEMLSSALQGSLHVDTDNNSGGSGQGGGGAPLSAARPSFASSNMSFGVSESMRRLVDDLMQGVVQDSFSAQSSARQMDSAREAPEPQQPASATAAAAGEAGQLIGSGVEPGDGPPSAGPSMDWASLLPPQGEGGAADGSAAAGGRDRGTSLSTQTSGAAEQVTLLLLFPDGAAAGEGAEVKAELQVLPLQQGPSTRLSPFQSLTSETLTAHLAEAEAEQEAAEVAAQPASSTTSAAGQVQPGPAAAAAAAAAAAPEAEAISRAESGITAGGSGAAVPDEGAVHDALLIQQFLEGNPNQLTWHGLHAVMDGLREEQLAVFFRNNHFNTLLKWQGGLYILVTDQGYQYEPDVIWEHLASVDGDTQFVDASFRPFLPHANALPAATGQAAAAEFGGAAAGAGDLEDADFALALALQQEEHDRLDREAQRSAQAAAAAAAPSAGGTRPAQAAARQQQQGRQAAAAAAGQRRPAPGRAAVERSGGSGSGSSLKKMKRKVKGAMEECVIM